MKHRIKKIKAASKQSKLVTLALFMCAFGAIGGLIILRSRAATGVCSTANVVGTAAYTVSAPETAQYRLWVRMQIPDTTNTNNTNGVKIELAGSSSQCFTVTTTSQNAVGQWQWVNSDATASSTAHITAQLTAGNYNVKVLGMKAGVLVDKVLLLKQDNTCIPSNDFSTGQPGDNCTTPAPVVTISATPTTVTTGGSTTLSWSASNSTSCAASGASGWSGDKQASGSETKTNLTSNQTFTLACTGPGGSRSASVAVTVTAPPQPTVSISANPATVISGGSTTLTWSAANATSCNGTGGTGWAGSKTAGNNQSQVINNITSNQTFGITCTGAGGSVSASTNVTVTVNPPSDTAPPVVTMNIQGLSLGANQTSVTVNTQKVVVFQPLASDASGVKSVAMTVNGQATNLAANGTYTIGSQPHSNGNYDIRITATDNRDNVTTKNLTIRLRHPDFDRSGMVDITDLNLLLSKWQQTSDRYDFNISDTNTTRMVDITDLNYLISKWFATQ